MSTILTWAQKKKKKNHENVQCSMIKNPEMGTRMDKQIYRNVLIFKFQCKILP